MTEPTAPNTAPFEVPPPPVMPAMPAAPPKAVPPVPVTVNPNAAPPAPPENPVTAEVPPPVSFGPPPPPGSLIGTGNPRALGIGVDPATAVGTFTPPPPKKPEPIRAGGNIKIPARTYHVDPIYPQIALAAKLNGYVILEAVVDESGVVKDLKVLRSDPMFDKSALEAVRKWRYTPTLLNGVAVPIVMTVTVTFSIR